MDHPLKNLADETGEVLKDTAVDIAERARNQVLGPEKPISQDKKDPVTGKPIPTKKVLTQLSQSAEQLRQARLQRTREELEQQRLKVNQEKQKLAPTETKKTAGKGPTMPESTVEKAPVSDAVAATLRGSKSTGEFGRQVGG